MPVALKDASANTDVHTFRRGSLGLKKQFFSFLFNLKKKLCEQRFIFIRTPISFETDTFLYFFVTRYFLIYPSYKTSSKQNRGNGTFFQSVIKVRSSTIDSSETEESSRPFNLVANERPNSVSIRRCWTSSDRSMTPVPRILLPR